MAASFPLAGLLDRAGEVFSLAGNLGREFQEELLGQNCIGPAGWNRHVPAFDSFCDRLSSLRDSMENPPDGFAPIADHLLKAIHVAKLIRDAMQTPDGRIQAAYQHFFPELNSVYEDGLRAVGDARKTQRPDDPLAIGHRLPTDRQGDIDTTPALPKPPANSIESAARGISEILANVQPRHDGTIEMVASHLVKRLQNAGHTLAAAHWAIHEAILAGRLKAGFIETELPSVGHVVGGAMRWLGGPDDRRMEWSGGGKGIIVIPKGKPAPFDKFKVTATERLWAWWRSSAVENTTHSEPAADELPASAVADSSGPSLPRDSGRDNREPAEASETETEKGQPAPKPFSGGTIVFFPDHVELCGVDICGAARSGLMRKALDLLRQKDRSGVFVAYSGGDFSAKIGRSSGKNGAAGLIRDLRDRIATALLEGANIVCGREDVILSGGRGYHLSEKLTVQDAPDFRGGKDQGHGPENCRVDVPNVPNPHVPNVPDDPDSDVPNVLDDATGARRAWILQQLAEGVRLKAAAVTKQFKCVKKTAQRDLTALKVEGKIEFVGTARTGHYRLRQTPGTGR